MPRHAGFALVTCMTEGLVNSVLRAGHANYVPPFQFSLPSPINVDGTSVNVIGSLIFVPPQVTLRARPDDLVTVNVGFAGQVSLSTGAQSVQTQVLLSATILVGLTSKVSFVGTRQSVTVGLNLGQASITGVQVTVVNGPTLSNQFNAALNSGAVVNALNLALHAIPPRLVQLNGAPLTFPLTLVQTYQPPGGSLFDPNVLFEANFRLGRIVVRPLDSVPGKPGVLALAVDMAEPQATTGDPNALEDLNTISAPHGNVIEFPTYGDATFSGGMVSSHHSDSAVTINGDWLSSVVNNVISPQLRGKFYADLATNHVAFRNSQDCVQLSFGAFNVPIGSRLSPPVPSNIWLNGCSIDVKLTRFADVMRDARGYYLGLTVGNIPDNIDIDFQCRSSVILSTFDALPSFPGIASGVPRATVSFSTNPDGGYFYIDGFPVVLGIGPYNYKSTDLILNQHVIFADPPTFSSWSTSGAVSVDLATKNPATLTVKGSGSIAVSQTSFDPLINRDHWSIVVVSTDITLPWWLDFLAVTNGPLYIAASLVATAFGADIWYPSVIENVNAKAQNQFQSAITGGLPSPIQFNKAMNIIQLPGMTGPDWLVTASDVVLSSQGPESHVGITLLPPGLVAGSPGSFPYLMVTDQDASDPRVIPDIPDPYGFPKRVDGLFKWPGVSWTPSQDKEPLLWDVHNLNPINVVLKIPSGLFNPQDPSVLVQWLVTRQDTHAVLISKTIGLGQAGAAVIILTVSIDHASAALQACYGFDVVCNVFRPQPGGSDPIFNARADIGIQDHFDRRHPYVQWGPHVKHVCPGEPLCTPSAINTGWWVKQVRQSRIHRTDFWGGGRRCLVADTSGSMGNPPKGGLSTFVKHIPKARTGQFPWIYLDSLPLSLAEVQNNRDVARGILCDYCFFGGPTNSHLRTDFPR